MPPPLAQPESIKSVDRCGKCEACRRGNLALCHYAMVFRGVLFKEIQGGGWRARAFRSAFR